jgi:hypothetical protein
LCRQYPRWEPYAGKPHVRICAGGARQLASLPLNLISWVYFVGFAFRFNSRQIGRIWFSMVLLVTSGPGGM